MYVDNCVPVDGKCKRTAYVLGVDKRWVKELKENKEEIEKEIEKDDRKLQNLRKKK